MASAEIAVAELREGFQPLRKDSPPLKEALQRAATAKGRSADDIRIAQATRVLEAAAAGVESGAASNGIAEASPLHAFSREPQLLFRALLFCGDLVALARSGLACRRWSSLVLHDTQKLRSPQYRLWRWALQWGPGIAPGQRIGFWRWCLKSRAIGPNTGPTVGGASPAGDVEPCQAVAQAAMKVDGGGLMRFASGLAGAIPGLNLAGENAVRIFEAASGATVSELPVDVLEGLLAEPYHLQRLWLLTDNGLPWLVLQARCLQVAIAAHQPQLFRHFMGEGFSPELFFCRWLQNLFLDCNAGAAEVARLWDLFLFERSHKVFVRTAVALFGLLEEKLRGDIDQISEAMLKPAKWNLEAGALLQASLRTKVTRSMLREASGGQIPGFSGET